MPLITGERRKALESSLLKPPGIFENDLDDQASGIWNELESVDVTNQGKSSNHSP